MDNDEDVEGRVLRRVPTSKVECIRVLLEIMVSFLVVGIS